MNELLAQMKRLGMTESDLMFELTYAGLISDNCIRVLDIAEPDRTTAVQWLKSKKWGYGADGNPNVKVLK